ncbi:MAG: helix-turn-helix domain-containing protein [Chloroflexota bacterium]|nr:helix-turn-helix domain-containing protein [Chloroflexota bacterium]
MAWADQRVVIVDDRAGFYMVPSAAIAKARRRLCGAQLTEALAGLACLARESFTQHGASRDEQQTLQANLDELAGRILGVSRARALRIVDNLADAGALTKDAHRFDGTRRLPTKITFVDLAHSFAYVSGPAFRALRAQSDSPAAPLGALALYLTLVALGGEQRDEFPDANRRTARASQPELAKLSGLSVSSVKRALQTLTRAGLISERQQPPNALKTTAVYRLIDPADDSGHTTNALGAISSQSNQWTTHSQTDDSSQPDRATGHSPTDDSSLADLSTAHSATDRPLSQPSRAHVKTRQTTAEQQNTFPFEPGAAAHAGDGGEVPSGDADRLIDVFSTWSREVLGDRRAAALYDERGWHRAAHELLEQYDLDRLLAGLDRLRRDALLADKATTLPTFAKIADRAITRAAADQAFAQHRAGSAPGAPAAATGPSWASAQALLRQAISAFGPSGEDRGLVFLSDHDPHLAAFAKDIGWRALARCDEQMTDIKYAYLNFSATPRPEAA